MPPTLAPSSITDKASGSLLIAAVVVGLFAISTSGVLVRLAEAPSLALALWRCLGGAAALAPFALRSPVRAAAGQRRQLAGSGLMLALHFALYISAVGLTTVASAVLLSTMSPLFVGLGAALLLREPPGRCTWVGMALATAGALVVGTGDVLTGLGGVPPDPLTGLGGVPPDPLTGTAPLGGRALLGDAMGFGAAAMVAGYFLVGRAARRRLPVSVYGLWVYGTAAGALLVACLATGTTLGGFDPGTWLAIGGLIVGPQLLGHTVFNQLLSALPATTVAVVMLAEPVGAGLLAWLVLGELPSSLFALGAPLVLAGVWLAAVPRRVAMRTPPT